MTTPCVLPDQIGHAVDELLVLVHETYEYRREEEVQVILHEAVQGLLAFRHRLQVADGRYVVAVVGLSNVGKSTLLNALLGSDLAPRRNGPCTAAPIEFAYGESLMVTAYCRQSLRRPSWPCENVEAIHERLSALADDEGAETNRSLRKLVVESPNSLLQQGLIIADTPGFGAAQMEQASGSHEASLKDYLQQEISQVFWVVLAEQGIGKREKAFYERSLAEVCDDVVVTGCEGWSQVDRERFKRRFATCFGKRMPAFHFVSGLAGLKARQADDIQQLEAAGIPALETRIRELATHTTRLAVISDGILRLAADMSFWLSQFKDQSRGRSQLPFWRPDSWSRWQEGAATSDFIRQVTSQLEHTS